MQNRTTMVNSGDLECEDSRLEIQEFIDACMEMCDDISLSLAMARTNVRFYLLSAQQNLLYGVALLSSYCCVPLVLALPHDEEPDVSSEGRVSPRVDLRAHLEELSDGELLDLSDDSEVSETETFSDVQQVIDISQSGEMSQESDLSESSELEISPGPLAGLSSDGSESENESLGNIFDSSDSEVEDAPRSSRVVTVSPQRGSKGLGLFESRRQSEAKTPEPEVSHSISMSYWS